MYFFPHAFYKSWVPESLFSQRGGSKLQQIFLGAVEIIWELELQGTFLQVRGGFGQMALTDCVRGRWYSKFAHVVQYSRQNIFGCFRHPLWRPKYPFTPHSNIFFILSISFDFLLTFSVQSGSHFSGSRTFCWPVPPKLASAAKAPQLNLEYTPLRLLVTPRRTKQT